MTQGILLPVILICGILLPGSFAAAQWRTSQDAEVCVTGTGSRGLDIAVCTRALGRDDLSDLDRASVHAARGRALREVGKLTAALADFDAALALNPYSADAFNDRALTLDGSGEYLRALEDFQRAIALSPRFAVAYRNRGVSHFYAGNLRCARVDFDAAIALARDDAESHAFRGFLHYHDGRYRDAADDFQRVQDLALPYPYLPLWRYLAGAGDGDAARVVLVEAHIDLLPGEWPQPLIEAFLGKIDPAVLITTLEQDDRSSDGHRRLAASHYYLAALDGLNGRGAQARHHLTKTLALSEHRMPERVLAEHDPALAGGEPRTGGNASASECRR